MWFKTEQEGDGKIDVLPAQILRKACLVERMNTANGYTGGPLSTFKQGVVIVQSDNIEYTLQRLATHPWIAYGTVRLRLVSCTMDSNIFTRLWNTAKLFPTSYLPRLQQFEIVFANGSILLPATSDNRSFLIGNPWKWSKLVTQERRKID